MLTISLCNNKGGVGKTTSTFNLANYLSSIGLKLLLIDLDPQGNLTTGFGVDVNEINGTAYDYMEEFTLKNTLKSKKDINQYLIDVKDNISLFPANLTLEQANINLLSEMGREYILKKALMGPSRFYDVCLIDCSPSLSTLTLNALVASNYVFIPMKAGVFELMGSRVLTQSIESIKLTFNEELEIGGVFLTLYDKRSILSRDITEQLEEMFGEKLMMSTIRNSVSAKESIYFNQSIFEYRPKSDIAKDYEKFCKEVMKITGITKPRKKKVANK